MWCTTISVAETITKWTMNDAYVKKLAGSMLFECHHLYLRTFSRTDGMETTQWYITTVGRVTSNHTEFPRSLKPHLAGYSMRTTKRAACVRIPTAKINGSVSAIFLLWNNPIIICFSNLNIASLASYQIIHDLRVKPWNTSWVSVADVEINFTTV